MNNAALFNMGRHADHHRFSARPYQALEVLDGGAPMSSEIARRVISSFRHKAKTRDKSLHLSTREEQILLLLTKGCSNKMIADRLDLSVVTISHHLKHVFEKMHVSCRTEAAIRYMSLHNPPE